MQWNTRYLAESFPWIAFPEVYLESCHHLWWSFFTKAVLNVSVTVKTTFPTFSRSQFSQKNCIVDVGQGYKYASVCGSVNLRILSEFGKIQNRETPFSDLFNTVFLIVSVNVLMPGAPTLQRWKSTTAFGNAVAIASIFLSGRGKRFAIIWFLKH